MVPKDIFIGEYANYLLSSEGEVFTHIKGDLKKFAIPEKVITGSAGHPYGTFIAESGQVYLVRSGDLSVKAISIKNGVKSSSWYNRHVVVCSDGLVRVFDEEGNIVTLKTNSIIKDVAASYHLLVLDGIGDVYQFDWAIAAKTIMPFDQLKNLNPLKIKLPAPATQIASGVIQAAVVQGDPWVWTDTFGARFVKNTAGVLSPTSFRPRMRNDEKVISIAASDNTLHIVTDAGRLMGLGNTWIGEIGNGTQAPKITETNVADFAYTQYFYDFVDISQGRKYQLVRSGSYYGFRHFALEPSSTIIQEGKDSYRVVTTEPIWSSWGYSKFGLLMNGITPVDDPANVAKASVKVPRRISIPESTKNVTTAEVNSMIAAGTYPPPEATPNVTYGDWIIRRKLVAVINVYDNGDVEKQPIK